MGNEKMETERRVTNLYVELQRGSNYTFGVRLNLKTVKNRNTLIEQSTTLIEHSS